MSSRAMTWRCARYDMAKTMRINADQDPSRMMRAYVKPFRIRKPQQPSPLPTGRSADDILALETRS